MPPLLSEIWRLETNTTASEFLHVTDTEREQNPTEKLKDLYMSLRILEKKRK